MTKEKLVEHIRSRAKNTTRLHLASELRVAPSHLADVLNNGRDPQPALLKALGFEKVISYQRIKERQS